MVVVLSGVDEPSRRRRLPGGKELPALESELSAVLESVDVLRFAAFLAASLTCDVGGIIEHLSLL